MVTNQKHAKNPMVPVNKTTPLVIINMYPKYKIALVVSVISNLLLKKWTPYKKKYTPVIPLVKKLLHHQL